MPDPGQLVSAASGSFTKLLPQVMTGLKYVIFIAIAMGVFYFIYMFVTFNMKAEVFPLYGSGKDGIFSIGKKKRNRLKWNRGKTAWIALFPLFNNKEIEPFDDEYMYAGKQIYVFELNGEWMPGRLNIDTEEKIRGEIKAVPYVVRNWQSLQHKKHSQEFAETDWWNENKSLMIGLFVCIACLVAVCVTVYFTYQHANSVAGALNNIAKAPALQDIAKGLAPT